MPTKRPAPRKPPISTWFKQWLSAKDTQATFEEKRGELKDDLLGAVEQWGEEDADGNIFYDLPEPIQFTDYEGNTSVYRTLKAERHLKPSKPIPDAEKALQLLKSKGLWLTEKELKVIRDLEARCPYAIISVDIDADAVALAYFREDLTKEEYEGTLVEQVKSFHFIPQK